MQRKKLLVLDKEYSKSAFEKAWSDVVNTNECNYFLRGEAEKFVDAVVALVPTWEKIRARGGTRYKIRNKKFQGRAVRGVVLITPKSKSEIWVGKGVLLEVLFPRSVEVPQYVQNRKQALLAMRQVIEPQIKTYRTSVLRHMKKMPLKCALTGDFVETQKFHIDHRYPFKNLVEEWCRAERLDLERVDVYCRGTKCYFRDTVLAESWFDFHMMNAQLQVVTATANLKKGAKYYG